MDSKKYIKHYQNKQFGLLFSQISQDFYKRPRFYKLNFGNIPRDVLPIILLYCTGDILFMMKLCDEDFYSLISWRSVFLAYQLFTPHKKVQPDAWIENWNKEMYFFYLLNNHYVILDRPLYSKIIEFILFFQKRHEIKFVYHIRSWKPLKIYLSTVGRLSPLKLCITKYNKRLYSLYVIDNFFNEPTLVHENFLELKLDKVLSKIMRKKVNLKIGECFIPLEDDDIFE